MYPSDKETVTNTEGWRENYSLTSNLPIVKNN